MTAPLRRFLARTLVRLVAPVHAWTGAVLVALERDLTPEAVEPERAPPFPDVYPPPPPAHWLALTGRRGEQPVDSPTPDARPGTTGVQPAGARPGTTGVQPAGEATVRRPPPPTTPAKRAGNPSSAPWQPAVSNVHRGKPVRVRAIPTEESPAVPAGWTPAVPGKAHPDNVDPSGSSVLPAGWTPAVPGKADPVRETESPVLPAGWKPAVPGKADPVVPPRRERRPVVIRSLVEEIPAGSLRKPTPSRDPGSARHQPDRSTSPAQPEPAPSHDPATARRQPDQSTGTAPARSGPFPSHTPGSTRPERSAPSAPGPQVDAKSGRWHPPASVDPAGGTPALPGRPGVEAPSPWPALTIPEHPAPPMPPSRWPELPPADPAPVAADPFAAEHRARLRQEQAGEPWNA